MSYVIIYKFKIQGKNKDKIVSKRALKKSYKERLQNATQRTRGVVLEVIDMKNFTMVNFRKYWVP